MTTAYVTELLSEQHRDDLRREACTARLAVLARCCSPKTWGRTARRVVEAVGRLRAVVGGDRTSAARCTA